MPDLADIGFVLLHIRAEEFQVLLDPAHRGCLGYLDVVELLQVISNLPQGHPLEVEIKGEGDGLRVMLHALEPLVRGEPVAAVLAGVPLDLAEPGCPASIPDHAEALTCGAEHFGAEGFDLLMRGLLLDVGLQLQGELDRVDMLADLLPVDVIRAGAGPHELLGAVALRPLPLYPVVGVRLRLRPDVPDVLLNRFDVFRLGEYRKPLEFPHVG